MNYAIIEESMIINIVVGPLPDGMEGVPVSKVPAAIGDSYNDGIFLRDGVVLLTYEELAAAAQPPDETPTE